MEPLLTTVKKLKRHIGEHDTRGAVLDAELLDYLNDAVQFVCAKVLHIRDDFFQAYTDITLDGSQEYALPLGVHRVTAVENITAGAANPSDTEPVYYENRFNQMNFLQSLGGRITYYVRNGKIGTPGKNQGGTLRVYYSKVPVGMFYATADSADSTTITQNATSPTLGSLVDVDDWYNGMMAVDETGEFHMVTDYVGSTNVFTAGTWITTPTVYSVVPPLSPRFYQLIPLEAAISWRIGKDDIIVELQNRANTIWNDFEALLLREQVHRSRHVKRRRPW